MLIGTFTHGKGFAYFSFSIGHKNQIDSHAITWNCLKLTAIQSRYNLCQFWMTVKMHYKSYIYSVNYNSEFHIITKIQIFNWFFFVRNIMPFQEYWWKKSETDLTVHLRGKSGVCYISVLIVHMLNNVNLKYINVLWVKYVLHLQYPHFCMFEYDNTYTN